MGETNRQLVLARRPTGMVDNTTVAMKESPAPEPGPDEALVRVRYLSIDPTIRTWMNDAPGYLPAIEVGGVVRSGGIGEIVSSNSERFSPGDLVFGTTGWQDYCLASGAADGGWISVPEGIDPPIVLNVLGINGLTAYFGMLDVGALKEGDVVVVSGAAGATGSAAGQIAKLSGASKVVGLAGTDEKCRWLTEDLGFDVAINYRTGNVARELRAACPAGIDIYFDNVGGEILDHCLALLAMRGRVVLCGAISGYNDIGSIRGPSNYTSLIIRRGRMEGFLVLDYADRFAEAQGALVEWLLDGRLRHAEVVVDGLERAVDALNMLFTGANTGKVVVKV